MPKDEPTLLALAERCEEALFNLSDSIRLNGMLENDDDHARYEAMVKAWTELRAAMERKITMTDAQIKHMTERFLGWRLPDNFRPDAGISFKPTFNDHLPEPTKHNPTGTNLFDYTQAEAMVRHMAEDLPEAHP